MEEVKVLLKIEIIMWGPALLALVGCLASSHSTSPQRPGTSDHKTSVNACVRTSIKKRKSSPLTQESTRNLVSIYIHTYIHNALTASWIDLLESLQSSPQTTWIFNSINWSCVTVWTHQSYWVTSQVSTLVIQHLARIWNDWWQWSHRRRFWER